MDIENRRAQMLSVGEATKERERERENARVARATTASLVGAEERRSLVTNNGCFGWFSALESASRGNYELVQTAS